RRSRTAEQPCTAALSQRGDAGDVRLSSPRRRCVTATLERETLATRSSRDVARLPQIWVERGETDLGVSQLGLRDRLYTPSFRGDTGTLITDTAFRLGYGRQPLNEASETWCV